MCRVAELPISTIWFFLNSQFFGAFFGAFCAFIFGVLAYDYTKRRERYKQHYDAVVKAEHLVNRHLNQISGNLLLLRGSLETYSKGAFSENVLIPIENLNLLADFYNIQLINKYADYQSFVEVINHDIAGWNRSNDRMFTTALSGTVPQADIAVNRKYLSERTQQMTEHLEDLMQEAYSFGGYVRVFLKRDKRAIFSRLKPTADLSISSQESAKERAVFVKESKETMKRDEESRLKRYQK